MQGMLPPLGDLKIWIGRDAEMQTAGLRPETGEGNYVIRGRGH